MKMRALSIVLVAGVAGYAMADDVFLADIPLVPEEKIGAFDHIYYNLGTGEYIVTQAMGGQTTAVDGGASELIWEVQGTVHQCDGINGHGGEGDQVSGLVGGDRFPETDVFQNGSEWSSLGDIATDTVIDCIGFDYWSAHADTDLDGDGVADGVLGFGMTLTWYDADNGGGANACISIPLVRLTFGGLPGIFGSPPGFFAGHFFTVDLGDASSFVIGDSDGDFQGAAFGGVAPGGYPTGEPGHDIDADGRDDADIDGDGLFDFSRGVTFIQPGTFDFDGDGVIDGDVSAAASTALSLGRPRGWTSVPDGEGGWEIEIDDSVEAWASGAEVYTALYTPDGDYQGLYCSDTPHSCDEDAYAPYFTIAHALYTPSEAECRVDVNGDGALNFFDVGDFLVNYAAGVDYNRDGEVNFFDVGDFLAEYAAGCS